ncbi:MAG TPA: CpsD/CapB family tyrosine-protein kinase [Candidatus Acidoferrales bacterium]|nr:CpsD/CapB family tyrosine-protein kinase [Candidatus Acidoferrales bacterium]
MSRIHEALRKAAEERAANPPAEMPIKPFETTDPTTGAAPVASPASMSANVASATATMAPPAFGPELTVDALLAKALHQEWKPGSKKLLFMNGNAQESGAEEFRRLRSNLYQLRNTRELRTVLVTSAIPSEGKSFVTANLAQAITRQRERRVLVIDADLRLSTLHKALGAPQSPGLTDYLRGDVDEVNAIQRGPIDNLFFIAGGTPTTNPLELLGNGRFRKLLDRVTPVFDWVILDSPPMLPVSDTSVMAEHCDGVLLVVRAKMTPFDVIQKVKKQLGDKKILGVVLNAVDDRDAYGPNYYYSGYYGAGKPKSGAVLQDVH